MPSIRSGRLWDSPFPSRITPQLVRQWVKEYPTPFYVYDLETLHRRIEEVKNFPHPAFSSFTPRYALKANPSRALIEVLDRSGIAFDASSGYEVERLLKIGIAPEKILLTSQQIPASQERFLHLFNQGLIYNATSLRQLEWYGKMCRGQNVSLRINPGFGSGMNIKTTVGGRDSGFGIWHQDYPEVLRQCRKYRLKVERIHTHVGSGSDPGTWGTMTASSLSLLKHFPSVRILNIGGGFKVGRYPQEHSADLKTIGTEVLRQMEAFSKSYYRTFDVEIEPGTYYVAEAGLLIAQVEDVITTGATGKRKGKSKERGLTQFVKINAGMNDFIRPSLYHSRHHINIIPRNSRRKVSEKPSPYIVIGHCCESGDQISQHPTQDTQGEVNTKAALNFSSPQPGDPVIIHGTGAYGSAMSNRYNSYPLIAEYLFQKPVKRTLGKPCLVPICKAETLDQMMSREIPLDSH